MLPPLVPLSSFGPEQEDEKSFGDEALDFLFRDDVNTVKDGDAPFWERAVAAAGLIPIPVGKGIKGASVVAKGITGDRKAGKGAERAAPGARAAPRAGDLSRLSLKQLESHANNDSGRKHAEQNITDWARDRGYKAVTVGAGRSHCEPCVDAIERARRDDGESAKMSASLERLETVAPDLAGRFRGADPRALRSAALAAARYAIGRAGVCDPAVEHALGEPRDERLRDELERLAQRLDDEYFDLQEAHEAGSASEQDYLEAFARARAVSAVWQALHPDPLTAALEATYEAYSAFGDGGEALAAAESALGGS